MFANCIIGMIGNEIGHLQKCVKLYGKLINKSEIYNIYRGNIDATLLKILLKHLFSVNVMINKT